MFVAVDDTDSMRGNCTTYLATEIIHDLIFNSNLDLIGPPRLIRLNPAIPWKTRGNGSLVMCFGRGKGNRTFIGEIEGKSVYCYDEKDDWEPDKSNLLERIIPLVEKLHDPTDSDPGVVISDIRPDYGYYLNGVRRVMERSTILDEIERIGALRYEIGCGRGIIGSVCGMAWIPKDFTYELLAYRPVERWGTERKFDRDSVREADSIIETSFNSWEERFHKVAVVPGTPCPVMYGFRGDVIEDLIKGHDIIKTERQSRWLVFLTNQGTDDHIITDFTKEEFIPNSSYAVEGIVRKVERIRGGHTFMTMDTEFGELVCAAYEPSCEFRHVLDWLTPGDRVVVLGELRECPRSLNIEKIHVLETVEEYEKVSNPLCPSCGKSMVSVGKGKGYRCRKCGTRSDSPIMRKNTRWIVPGWYEPPVAARRHLSKPLKRMGEIQPVEFVNCRNQ